MYVISRVLSFEKGYDEQIRKMASQPSIMIHFPGFIRKDILFDQKDPEKDVLRIMVYWENKQAFYRFEGSPEHIAMHKNKDHAHHQKLEGLIDVKREAYLLIASDTYAAN